MAVVGTDARRALLERMIDHAPLFPPAALPMDEALAEDRWARGSAEAWMLGRFVCPASRLGELGEDEIPLSVVLDAPADLSDPRIEAVEVPPGGDEHPDAPEVYLEGRIEPGYRAKIRCGGATVPTIPELAAFIRACREAGIVFKATAGLHHAVRGPDEHGFLNLLAACVFGDEEEALAAEDFELTAERFAWGGREAKPEELARVRRELFAGFGSCSFREPLDELKALGIL